MTPCVGKSSAVSKFEERRCFQAMRGSVVFARWEEGQRDQGLGQYFPLKSSMAFQDLSSP